MRFFNRFGNHDREKEQPVQSAVQEPQENMIDKQQPPLDAPYLLAHDLPEHKRLEFQHFFLKGLLRANYLAPLAKQPPTSILDVGSGTGRWVIEMAQQFPQATVMGIDLQATTISAPLNTIFVQHNVLDGLPFVEHYFDYVHSRLLVAGIPAHSWSQVLREYARVTRPGGWIELLEGGTHIINAGPMTMQYLVWWDQLSEQRGIFDFCSQHISGSLRSCCSGSLMLSTNEPLNTQLFRWNLNERNAVR
jgi:SAM-dependent methyltransferase